MRTWTSFSDGVCISCRCKGAASLVARVAVDNCVRICHEHVHNRFGAACTACVNVLIQWSGKVGVEGVSR